MKRLPGVSMRSEEHTSELQSQFHLVCRLLLEKKKSFSLNSACNFYKSSRASSSSTPCASSLAIAPQSKVALRTSISLFFFFNDPATTEIYTLSLHDALPISLTRTAYSLPTRKRAAAGCSRMMRDRKSTRLNSSHSSISYAVFCLKKKKK